MESGNRLGKNAMNCEQVEAIVLDLGRDTDANRSKERLPWRTQAIARAARRCRSLGKRPEKSCVRWVKRLLKRGHPRVSRCGSAGVSHAYTAPWLYGVPRSWWPGLWLLRQFLWALWVRGIRQQARRLETEKQKSAAQNTLGTNGAAGAKPGIGQSLREGFPADDSGEFTPLPGTTLDETDEAAVLRVRMQRGALGALGLPVNEERAGEWIQVDLLVGNDGLPKPCVWRRKKTKTRLPR